ncbi:preprotein translocase subunit SecA [Temperatibacter marinus]|uniref:Protein translocase subunit SecA n=1 Tax=Temperatibacter marinus TaxID=1456591 RepID=A0AA52H9V4_9PROT|nr:preprotein translocase subunit SecA [Temperatibacter marinus]WND03309.1 preprotein translocase subunit SecA [Temperatibacter marinus]
MLGKLVKRLFGSANDRYLRTLQPKIDAINSLEPDYEALDDEALKGKSQEFRGRIEQGESLDDLLVEAFAAVREAGKRALGQRHYDVQLIGGITLHEGNIAEMRTGEGKTLVATLAAYLNALSGDGVHVVTVNDYLAKRDAEWMGKVYGQLGLTTGVVTNEITHQERRDAYAADITYGTNNEFGFDYLRDNMASSREEQVQRAFNFSIVDEVDSILVDEARTPLIISGPTEDKTDLYQSVDAIVLKLEEAHYEKDEKSKSISLTEEGTERVEELLRDAGMLQGDNLYDYENTAIVHHVDQALKSRMMFENNVDYIVQNGQVVIIDDHTGRMMPGRRYSGGLHQALEAKEGVEIQPENQTLASITFQNYFRMYPKLSGMTGTAATEAEEFGDIYGLGVIEIPTNLPVKRLDENDEFYRTANEKHNAIINDIIEVQEKGQPILVGTASIEKSEMLSGLLKARKIKHQVLNARYHEQEAYIVAQAGRPGAITIATNMAGRGTDIQLGGNADMEIAERTKDVTDEAKIAKITQEVREEIAANKQKVLDAGGLCIMGTERHESRRIDNQLRGRGGRQGDPGFSKFYLSLEDDLMRIFGPERLDKMLVSLGIEEGEAIRHRWIDKAIENSQQKVEARNYDIRKNIVKYDNVMNDQRKAIYEQRAEIMESEQVSEEVTDMRHEVIEDVVIRHIPPKAYFEQWDIDGLAVDVETKLGLSVPVIDWAREEGADEEVLIERLLEASDIHVAAKKDALGEEMWQNIEKSILLQIVDQEWQEHLLNLDHSRQNVSLRGYAQKDPLNEYKSEAFQLFEGMLNHTRETLTSVLSNIQFEGMPQENMFQPQERETHEIHEEAESLFSGGSDAPEALDSSAFQNVPRNAPCPCGSGEKFKHCHGSIAQTGPVASRSATALDPLDPETWGRVPRNSPCPCGSGKKFKHCHGQVS